MLVRSVMAKSLYGPVWPKGVIAAWTSRGNRAVSASWPRPSASSEPGGSASTSTSAIASSRSSRARPSAWRGLSVTPRLLVLSYQKRRLRFRSGRSPAKGPMRRAALPPGGSTAIASAPMSASSLAQNAERGPLASSTTRSPVSGGACSALPGEADESAPFVEPVIVLPVRGRTPCAPKRLPTPCALCPTPAIPCSLHRRRLERQLQQLLVGEAEQVAEHVAVVHAEQRRAFPHGPR